MTKRHDYSNEKFLVFFGSHPIPCLGVQIIQAVIHHLPLFVGELPMKNQFHYYLGKPFE